MLPQDGHVHSEWSWDAAEGDMERTCARALEIGLKSVAFTEHVDLTPWAVVGGSIPPGMRAHLEDGILLADPLDVIGYLESVQRCRQLFPDLRVLSGLEISEPHLHQEAITKLLAANEFDQVLGSVHSLADAAGRGPARDGVPAASQSAHGPRPEDAAKPKIAGVRVEITSTYSQRPALEVVRAYLAEVVKMAESDMPYSVLAHIDYPARTWPASAGKFEPALVEAEYRAALEALAASGRALEVNTRLRFPAQVLDWWHDAGGQAVTFGSDAHQPENVAWEFEETAAMVSAHGFRPGRQPSYGMWGRA
jgi:histidinol-phosphatase (PHP family)